MAKYVLEMRNISKSYGENPVLTDVNISIKPGEIHALLGENGAGKSTLMNILFGMPVIHEAGGFKGEVLFDGEVAKILSPYDAMDIGIGMVHQEFMLIPGFTVAENIKLNREISKPNIISRMFGSDLESLDMKAMGKDARRDLDTVGMSIEEYAYVKGLPVGYMQFVEIAREIDKSGIRLLVFDEPTAVLTESEAKQLLSVMRTIAEKDIAIIFITHRLDEVMAVADNITVLRDGKLAAVRETKDTNLKELASLMIGRSGSETIKPITSKRGKSDKNSMEIKDFTVAMPGESVKNASLEIKQGEILGIGGLAGQGKIGIPNGIMGLYPSSGEVTFEDGPFPLNDPEKSLSSGVAFVSEDRRGVGLLLDESIEDNIVFNAMQINGEFRKPMLPNPNKVKNKLEAYLLILVFTIGSLAMGFYGNSKWEDKTPLSNTSSQSQEELGDEEDVDMELAGTEDGYVEIEITSTGVDIDSSAPIIARISPLMFIFGFVGIASLVYLATYPYIHHITDKIKIKDTKAIRKYADKMIDELDIRCRDATQAVGTLSGGNQQKVCIARALAMNPKFLFASEPTRGIDIGAKEIVMKTLINLNQEKGTTIVVVSSELMELRSVSDRIAIVTEGKIMDIFAPDASDVDIGLAMSGITLDEGGN